MKRIAYLFAWGFLLSVSTNAANLTIHFIDAGNAEAIVIITPQKEVVLIDGGKAGLCDRPLKYLETMGIEKISYLITTHYHNDHIGCTEQILQKYPLDDWAIAYDRGEGKCDTVYYNKYIRAIGIKRTTAEIGKLISLDNNDVRIDFAAMNGNGIQTINENDLSLVSVLHYGGFDCSLAGDITGFSEYDYQDIETSVAPKIGKVEVYKVNHHCSPYSSNDIWLETLKPKVGILCVGNENIFHYPSSDCLKRLHEKNIDCYWTERGKGPEPDSKYDRVWKNIVIEVEKGGKRFIVKGSGGQKAYDSWPDSSTTVSNNNFTSTPSDQEFVWSVKGEYYHINNCPVTKGIKPENRRSGDTPPPRKKKHSCIK